jgi:hypothetical protein
MSLTWTCTKALAYNSHSMSDKESSLMTLTPGFLDAAWNLFSVRQALACLKSSIDTMIIVTIIGLDWFLSYKTKRGKCPFKTYVKTCINLLWNLFEVLVLIKIMMECWHAWPDQDMHVPFPRKKVVSCKIFEYFSLQVGSSNWVHKLGSTPFKDGAKTSRSAICLEKRLHPL